MPTKEPADKRTPRVRVKRNGHRAPNMGTENGTVASKNGDAAIQRAKHSLDSSERAELAKRALDTDVPITEWDRRSTASRTEVEHLVELLKAVKQGDFTVRFQYDKDGILSRSGELLKDIIGLNERMTSDLV